MAPLCHEKYHGRGRRGHILTKVILRSCNVKQKCGLRYRKGDLMGNVVETQKNKKESSFPEKRIKHWQIITFLLVCFDVLAVVASYYAALLVRFDLRFTGIPRVHLREYMITILPYAAVCVIVFVIFRLYRSLWRYVSFREVIYMIMATAVTFVINLAGTWLTMGRMPISYYIIGIVFQFILTMGIRLSYRFVLLLRGLSTENSSNKCRVMIVGAGSSGQMLLRDMRVTRGDAEEPVCFIDDNPNKWNRYIDGVCVVGGRHTIVDNVKKFNVQKIYVAIPAATARQKKEILEICNKTDCELKQLPGIYQLRTGEITVSAMKQVSVEDLLGREPIKTNSDEILEMLKGKVILVTGGGGSIGSELVRQIAKHDPQQLIIFDVYENNAYDIQQELVKKYPDLNLKVIIGSVRDSRKLWQVFDEYRPSVVFHAAAHKHVPLMEDSPCEAIKNNAIGTYKTAYAAMVFGVNRFVLISTDKAVNPTNIMGASKRICEMIIQTFNQKIKDGKADQIPQLFTHIMTSEKDRQFAADQLQKAHTEFVAVRFGNVLGSNGSVIPLFKKQIEAGGPVTVTHPDIIRYFMTIPEAVSLVIQANYYAKGGEIFVLDMGEPVKIDTLARNLIRLSGLQPDVDIPIVYTGLRPGEKLYEEKLMAEEGLRKTANDMIFIGMPIPFDEDEFLAQLGELMDVAYKNKGDVIRDYVAKIVKTYKPA